MQSKDWNIWITTNYIYRNTPTALICPKHTFYTMKNNSRNGELPVAGSSAFWRIKLMSASAVSTMPVLFWRSYVTLRCDAQISEASHQNHGGVVPAFQPESKAQAFSKPQHMICTGCLKWCDRPSSEWAQYDQFDVWWCKLECHWGYFEYSAANACAVDTVTVAADDPEDL